MKRVNRYSWVAAIALVLVLFAASGSLHAQVTAIIEGDIFTGGGSVTWTPDALGEPVANWNTVYHDPAATYLPGDPGAPLLGAQVMVQNQHSGGAFITYGTVIGNHWSAVVGPGDYVVMFSAVDHGTTSRQFSVDAAGVVTSPPGTGAWQDAYLPPLFDLDGGGVLNDLPRANLLHYVFYDKFVNGNDNGTQIDPGLNGVTVNVYDEEGNLLMSKVTGDVNNDGVVDDLDTFTTKDGMVFGGPLGNPVHGFVYFEGLPSGEVVVDSDPSTVTDAINPHFDLYIEDGAVPARTWSWTYTEEGGAVWDPKLWPGDPGTEAGFYLTWHGFIEKIGQVGDPQNPTPYNPGLTGTIEGVLLDADGNDPEEPFPPSLPGRVNGGFPNGLDVEPNARIPNGAVALYTVGNFPELVATTLATNPSGQNTQDGAEFTFVNVPPGSYEVFSYDVPLHNVPLMGIQVDVTPGSVSNPLLLLPRFGARGQGHVMNNGVPVAGATVKGHYKSGITKKETTTDVDGWFNFPFLPEVEILGHILLDLQTGSTIRGKIITEMFDPDGIGVQPPFPVTHNGMNRYVQWYTYNYYADIQVEPVPAATGDVFGVVFNDHFARGPWGADGIYDEHEERTFHGVTVELYDATGTTLLDRTTTGKFNKADTIALGWHEPYTWPPDEIGGVYAGPTSIGTLATDPLTGLPLVDPVPDVNPAPAIGFYEFRDLAPGTYRVKVVTPDGFAYSPSPAAALAGADGEDALVVAGQIVRVNVGMNSSPLGGTFGVPMAGEIEGGVFDDQNLDNNPNSLLFQEKAGIVGAPVGVYDHYNYLMGVMYMGDPLCYVGSTECPGFAPDPVPPGQGQKPEAEGRFAPHVHRYLGNDPAFLDGFDPQYDPMELAYTFPQGGYKFEADWSLLLAPTAITSDMCVVDLVGVDIPAEPGQWGAQATVTVHDGYVPLVGAQVFGDWSSGPQGTCITNAAGQCTVTLEKVEPPELPFVTFDVTRVIPVETWYLYNPDAALDNGYVCTTSTGPIDNPAGSPGAGLMHIADLDGVSTIKEGTKWFAEVTLSVVDTGGPVAGVKVFFSWAPGESKSCTTDGAGQCVVKSETIEDAGVTSISLTVDSVNDLAYNPALNSDPDPQPEDANGTTSDGTIITIYAP